MANNKLNVQRKRAHSMRGDQVSLALKSVRVLVFIRTEDRCTGLVRTWNLRQPESGLESPSARVILSDQVIARIVASHRDPVAC